MVDENTFVACYIDEKKKEWMKDLIESHFLPIDVGRILKVSISHSSNTNERCWVASHNGVSKQEMLIIGPLNKKTMLYF